MELSTWQKGLKWGSLFVLLVNALTIICTAVAYSNNNDAWSAPVFVYSLITMIFCGFVFFVMILSLRKKSLAAT